MTGSGPFGLNIEGMLAQARQTQANLTQLRARQAELRTTGSDDNGMIEVTVDGSGRVVDMTVNPRAMRLDSYGLREAVLAASREAYAAYDAQMDEMVGDAIGDRQLLADVRAGKVDPYQYLQRFGVNAPELRSRLGSGEW